MREKYASRACERLTASSILSGMKHPYLLSALLLAACYDDSSSQPSTGSGGTGPTTSSGNGTQTSGTANGGAATTASGGTTSSATSSATTIGGSGGEGQGGAPEGGAAGASGANAGGEGGAPQECVPAMHAVIRAIFGDFDCPPLEACIVESCSGELALAMGDGWSSGDHSGGICADYADCVETCDCESACSLECRDEHAVGECLDSVIEVSLCRNDACPTAADDCTP
jgi:hypothetical protein